MLPIASLKRLTRKILSARDMLRKKPSVLKSKGYCHACGKNSTFSATEEWLRDSFKCSRCNSIPRERALMMVLESYYPDWRTRIIHESSPNDCGASKRIANECEHYIPSQYFPGLPPGALVAGERCENLECLTFGDETIDIHITQDVMEHVFNPDKAFAEIARSLKPGGAHIFTTPLVNKNQPTKIRASLLDNGEINYLEEPVYHASPNGNDRALVTRDWGYDICEQIHDACKLYTHLVYIDDIEKGIRAELIEVLVTVKS